MFCKQKYKEGKRQGLKEKYIQGVQLKEEHQEFEEEKYFTRVLS